MPLSGSPLIAAADVNTCVVVALDQRGQRRNWLTSCDIGAVEFRYVDWLADPRTVSHTWLPMMTR